MNIVIVNSVSLNGGDAAILQALLASIHEQWGDAKVTVLDSHPEPASRYFPGIKFLRGFQSPKREIRGLMAGKRRWLQRRVGSRVHLARWLSAAFLLRERLDTIARALCSQDEIERLLVFRDANLVISTGGTYLVPMYHIENRLCELTLSHMFGVPLVLYTQSIGSFAGKPCGGWLRFCLQRAALVLLRDEQSLANVCALELDGSNCVVRPDSVFSMANEASLHASRTLPEKGIDVIVSVRDWPHFANGRAEESMSRYVHAVADAVAWLVQERGARVRFLSTCQGVPEYEYDDSVVAWRVRELVPASCRSQVHVDEARHDPQSLLEEFGKADLVIATRMHAAILGLCAGTTVLPIAYEFKTQELFRSLGISDWVEPIDLVTPFSLTQRIQLVLREADSRRTEVANAVLQKKQQAARALRRVPALSPKSQPKGSADASWLWIRVSPEDGFD